MHLFAILLEIKKGCDSTENNEIDNYKIFIYNKYFGISNI